MSHEPIILDRENWSDAHALVQYSLNRVVANQHELRNDLNSRLLQLENNIAEAKVRADARVARVEDTAHTNSTRIAVVEAKVIIYGLISGALGMAIMRWVLTKF